MICCIISHQCELARDMHSVLEALKEFGSPSSGQRLSPWLNLLGRAFAWRNLRKAKPLATGLNVPQNP